MAYMFQFVCYPPSLLGFDCITKALFLPSLIVFGSCFWMWNISFGRFVFFVNGSSAVNCDFGVFLRRGEVISFLLCHLASILNPHNIDFVDLHVFSQLIQGRYHCPYTESESKALHSWLVGLSLVGEL